MQERYPPACLAATVPLRASLALSLTAGNKRAGCAEGYQEVDRWRRADAQRFASTSSTKPELDP